MEKIEFIKLTETAKLPTRGSNLSSGMDLYADNFKIHFTNTGEIINTIDLTPDSISLAPLERLLIGTGLAVNLNINTEMQIRPRSGIALKEGLTVLNTPGTIDEDYKDEIGIILVNLSSIDVKIKLGERIAQAVISPVIRQEPILKDVLTGSNRGGGFGHTGKD